MAAAASFAARGRPLSRPNPAVGALLVHGGRVIARGHTQAGGRPHAEAQLFDELMVSAKGATLYVTLEPCAHESERGPACADLIAQARPSRVVIGQQDPDPRTAGKGMARLKRAGIETHLLGDEASASSLSGYLSQRRFGRPYVTLKLAISLDGCIALADGTSQWITGEEARAHVHAERARQDAILVGGATWRADKPRLDVRLPGLAQRSPERVLLTRGVKPDGVSIINHPQQIADMAHVQYLYIEGGGGTSASFLGLDLVDELHIYRAPIVIGEGLRAVADLGLGDLPSAHGKWRSARRLMLGRDEFTSYRRTRT